METMQTVFRRYEKKYRLTPGQYTGIRRALEGWMQPDRFYRSQIRSIYFDTPDRRLVRRSLEKPVYKEKLRLRSYGLPGAEDPVFVELKKKYRGVVYKRREVMTLREAEAYLYQGGPAPRDSQILREISRFLDFYPRIEPAMGITYSRTAWVGMEDPRLRITFDSDIQWRETELRLDREAGGEALLPPGGRLMEIKVPGAMPLWLARLLEEEAVYPASFSKYGRAYRQARFGKNKEGIICA